jgi:hypothetical protein
MTPEDRAAIERLFARLSAFGHDAPPLDPEAVAFINARLRENPAAAYHLAQTVIAQEQALAAAAGKAHPPRHADSPAGPWSRPAGGFLAGAAQTAMGVAGGFLIADMLSDLLGGSEAAAAERFGEGEDGETGGDWGGGDDGGDFDM